MYSNFHPVYFPLNKSLSLAESEIEVDFDIFQSSLNPPLSHHCSEQANVRKVHNSIFPFVQLQLHFNKSQHTSQTPTRHEKRVRGQHCLKRPRPIRQLSTTRVDFFHFHFSICGIGRVTTSGSTNNIALRRRRAWVREREIYVRQKKIQSIIVYRYDVH